MEKIENIFSGHKIYSISNQLLDNTNQWIEGNLDADLVICYISLDQKPLAEEVKAFLLKMLSAVKHDLSNTLLIHSNAEISFQQIAKKGKATKIISFGNSRKQLGLNLNLKRYQLFQVQNIDCLFIDHLALLMTDQKRKARLWSLMKQMFAIA